MASAKNPPAPPEEPEVPAEDSPDEEVVVNPDAPESKILEMASAVITGDVFKGTDENGEVNVAAIVEFRTSFGKYLEGLKGIAKSFDTQLVNLRAANGDDFLKEVEHFRKPRESKTGNNSLLDSLKL